MTENMLVTRPLQYEIPPKRTLNEHSKDHGINPNKRRMIADKNNIDNTNDLVQAVPPDHMDLTNDDVFADTNLLQPDSIANQVTATQTTQEQPDVARRQNQPNKFSIDFIYYQVSTKITKKPILIEPVFSTADLIKI